MTVHADITIMKLDENIHRLNSSSCIGTLNPIDLWGYLLEEPNENEQGKTISDLKYSSIQPGQLCSQISCKRW